MAVPASSEVIDFRSADRSGRPNSARVRILRSFADRLRAGGIRQITMTELAQGLGMSKKTLYENFSNKEDVLTATVELWVEGFLRRMADAETAHGEPNALVHALAEAHMDSVECFSTGFWFELPRDYPVVHERVTRALGQANRQARIALSKHLRPGVAPRVATETFLAMIARTADPEVCRRLEVTRRELTMAALDIWARGALLHGTRDPSPEV